MQQPTVGRSASSTGRSTLPVASSHQGLRSMVKTGSQQQASRLHSSSNFTTPHTGWLVSYAAQRLPRRALNVVCMAHPRRVARVAKQIEREVGTMLLHDRLLLEAVCPERRRGLDTAVSALASVTEVVVSNDLQVAKVYVSVFSDEAGKETAMAGLKKLEGYVRKQIGRLIRLRLTPEIRFLHDDSIERSERVLALLDRIKKQEQGLVEAPPIALPSGFDDGEDDDDIEARYGDWLDMEGVVDDLDPEEDDDAVEEAIDALLDDDDGDDGEGLFDMDGEDDDAATVNRMAAAALAGASAADMLLPPRQAPAKRGGGGKGGKPRTGGGRGRK